MSVSLDDPETHNLIPLRLFPYTCPDEEAGSSWAATSIKSIRCKAVMSVLVRGKPGLDASCSDVGYEWVKWHVGVSLPEMTIHLHQFASLKDKLERDKRHPDILKQS